MGADASEKVERMLLTAFPHSFNLIQRYGNKVRPTVPFVFRLICEEILERANCPLFRLHYPCVNRMFYMARRFQLQYGKSDYIQSLLTLYKKEPRPNRHTEPRLQRILLCYGQPTHLLLSTLLEFNYRCEDGVRLQFTYPSCGWLFFAFPNVLQYFPREMALQISQISRQDGVRCDIFCFIMQFLTALSKKSMEFHRSEPLSVERIKYSLANHFSREVGYVRCESCGNTDWRTERTCAICSLLTTKLRRDPILALVFNALNYLTPEFWLNMLKNTRGNARAMNGHKYDIHESIKMIFITLEQAQRKRKVKRLKQKMKNERPKPPLPLQTTTTTTTTTKVEEEVDGDHKNAKDRRRAC